MRVSSSPKWSMVSNMQIKRCSTTGELSRTLQKPVCTFWFRERQNTRTSRDRLLEEQNTAYLDSMRADQEKVCYSHSLVPTDSLSFVILGETTFGRRKWTTEIRRGSATIAGGTREKTSGRFQRPKKPSFENSPSRSSRHSVIESGNHCPMNQTPPSRISFKYPYVCLPTSPFVVVSAGPILPSFCSSSPGRTPTCPINSSYCGAIHASDTSTQQWASNVSPTWWLRRLKRVTLSRSMRKIINQCLHHQKFLLFVCFFFMYVWLVLKREQEREREN